MGLRLLVCGGRDFGDEVALFLTLAPYALRDGVTLVCGMARGADALAYGWARFWGHAVIAYPADWQTHGLAAGSIRNQQMLDEGRPDTCVAFPGGRGTADMMRRCRIRGVPVREVSC